MFWLKCSLYRCTNSFGYFSVLVHRTYKNYVFLKILSPSTGTKKQIAVVLFLKLARCWVWLLLQHGLNCTAGDAGHRIFVSGEGLSLLHTDVAGMASLAVQFKLCCRRSSAQDLCTFRSFLPIAHRSWLGCLLLQHGLSHACRRSWPHGLRVARRSFPVPSRPGWGGFSCSVV